ncbi:hypothetical protein HXY32_04295 [Candidatus Bathyarchaeota archaeon]|nr:hypothetical protein [Candidatus Bathyarchaeota archaeon]
MKERTTNIQYSFLFCSMLCIALCLLLSFVFINPESVLMLIVFNFLFASLMFPLKGSLARKTCLLLIGNVIDLFWNYLFFLFAFLGVNLFGEGFNGLYLILNPFANLVWIISFWSISLTALAESESRKTGVRIGN